MKKKRFKGTLFYAFFIFVLYFILFPIGTGKDLVVKPLSQISLSKDVEPSQNYSNKNETAWFRVGGTFGYIDDGLNLLYKDSIDYDCALSNGGFINYSSIQEGEQGFVYCNVRGEVKSSFHSPGYPVLNRDGKKILIVKTDGTGIREVSSDGEERWNASFASIITAISVRSEYALLGLLSGALKLYNEQGKCLYSITLHDSKPESIYGCVLSSDEKAMAAVYGVQPQRIVIIKKGTSSFAKPVSRDIDTDFRRPVFMDFSDNGRFLFVEGKEKVIVIDADSRAIWSIPMRGKFESLSQSEDLQEAVVITRMGNSAGVYLFSPPNFTFVREIFVGANVSARLFGKHLLVGLENELLVYEIGEV